MAILLAVQYALWHATVTAEAAAANIVDVHGV